MVQSIPFYKRVLSYLYPLRIRQGSSAENPVLELLYYQGRWQLATADAVYSDGNKYRPLVLAFRALEHKLGKVNKVLVLGTGLGSAVQILNGKGYEPEMTLLEYDKTVLKWAMEFLPQGLNNKIRPVCDDARHFMQQNKEQYDLLIIDIFKGRIVPGFISEVSFLQQCRDGVSTGGDVVFNYIINEPEDWQKTRENFTKVFPVHNIIENGVNRILIATV